MKDDSGGSFTNSMVSPKCLVTGVGCSYDKNPNLHSPASRIGIVFDGPTRRGGRVTQSCDVTMLDHLIENNNDGNGHDCIMTKRYSQSNIDQDLQTFYRETTSFRQLNNNGGSIIGKIGVAAFLPYYIKEMDANKKSGGDGGSKDAYDENEAVAIYDYKISIKSIDELEAISI
jgi:hypothetical protein